MKKIFVVLVNYNGLHDTLECIESINKSCLHGDVSIKIIVIDNASKVDETLVIKEKYLGVIAIRSDVNGGFSSGNNIGIRYALENGADYIMLLNNDTVIAPNMVSLLLEECKNDTVTVPKMFYYSEPTKIWYGGGEINRWTGNAVHTNMDKDDNSETEPSRLCSFATGCCIMLKAETFKRVGLLNEKYFMYCEDMEFSIRLAENGVSIKYIPQAKLWHKVSVSTGGSCSPFSTYYMTRNRLNCIRENGKYYHFTAYWFSLLTRYIRMLQAKDKGIKNAFLYGINDHYRYRYGAQINS